MRYQRINQKKYCCVAACLEMIFKAEGYDFDQVDIACGLGLIVPKKDLIKFPCALTGEKPSVGWGTQIQKDEYSLWNYLAENIINIELNFFSSDQVTPSLLKEWLSLNRHIMVMFNYPKLYDIDGSWGHASLITQVSEENTVMLDPSSKYKELREVNTKRLVDSTLSRTKLGWGFWVFAR